MLNVQQYLKNKNFFSLQEEFGITTALSPDKKLGILNYCQIDSQKFKTHPIVKECRGLVVELSTSNIVAKPFNRFFNYGEDLEGQKSFNWNSFVTQEKCDGSLLLCYNYLNEWHLNTRNSFGYGEINKSSYSWRSLFLPFFKNLDQIPSNYTLVAEGCSIFNQVVRAYPDTKVYLLSVFNRDTCEELSVEQVDEIAKTVGLERPQIFNFSSVEELKDYLLDEGKCEATFEGFVICDVTGNRIKLKNARYVALHRLANNGQLFLPQAILPIVLSGEVEETLLYMPHFRPYFEKVIEQVNGFSQRLRLTWEQSRGIVSQKEFALAIKDEPLKAILFNVRKTGDFEKAFRDSESILLKAIL